MHACIVVVSVFGASWHSSGPEMTILHAKHGTHHHGMHCALLRGHQQHAPLCGRVPTVSRCRVHSRLQSSSYRPQHVWGQNSQRCDAQHIATQADREDARPVIVSSSVWQPCLWMSPSRRGGPSGTLRQCKKSLASPFDLLASADTIQPSCTGADDLPCFSCASGTTCHAAAQVQA